MNNFAVAADLYPASVRDNSPVRAYVKVSILRSKEESEDNVLMTISGVKVLEGNRGLFVVWPEYRINDKKYHPIKIVNSELRHAIVDLVLDKYKVNDFASSRKTERKNDNEN